MKDFFVMLNTYNDGITPLVEEDECENDIVMLFKTEKEARAAANKCPLAQACGYEIFCRGDGE